MHKIEVCEFIRLCYLYIVNKIIQSNQIFYIHLLNYSCILSNIVFFEEFILSNITFKNHCKNLFNFEN